MAQKMSPIIFDPNLVTTPQIQFVYHEEKLDGFVTLAANVGVNLRERGNILSDDIEYRY